MRKIRTMVALAASLALASCQTLENVRVNGQDLSGKNVQDAQAGGLCAQPLICVLIGAAVIGGGAWLIWGDDDDDDDEETN